MRSATNTVKDPLGPQGTQLFQLNDINALIAQEVLKDLTDEANTPCLVGLNGAIMRKEFLLKGEKLSVGRSEESDLTLLDPSVSSLHAQLVFRRGDWHVINMLSSNGVRVNGEKTREHKLTIGDRVAFGGCELVYTKIKVTASSQTMPTGLWFGVGVVAAIVISSALYFLI